MRKIIITVTEENDGEEANIDVNHFHDGKDSELEYYTVQMLNEFLFMKVGEVTKSKPDFKTEKTKIRNNEMAN